MFVRGFFRDAGRALRSLWRTPGFATVAILTLALGIGANAAIFTVVNGVLLRALPFRDIDRVVRVYTSNKTETKGNYSAGAFLDLGERNHSLQALAGYREDLVALTAGGQPPIQVGAAYVTPGFFEVVGTPAEIGRPLSSAAPTGKQVVLSHDAWHDLFQEDPSAVGATVRVNGDPYMVVGVMVDGFRWPADARVWVLSDKKVPPSPIDYGDDPTHRDVRYFEAVARLRPDWSIAKAQGDLDSVAAELAREHPATDDRDLKILPLREELVGDVRPALIVLQGAVGVVLLIACANVSSLLLARTFGRRRELAIRAALGAGRRDLLKQLLTESLVLGLLGGLAGLLLGAWLVPVLAEFAPGGVFRTQYVRLDTTVTIVTMVVALGTGVLFGLLPALQASQARAIATIRDQGDRVTAARARARSGLVVLEIALTLMLLAAAGLLLNSFLRLERVDSGFQPDHVVVAGLLVPQNRYPTGEQQAALYRQLVERISQHNEIDAVAVGFPGPLKGDNASGDFYLEGRDATKEPSFAHFATISGGYFRAMGLTVVAGRTFAETDGASAPKVMIVNETLAHRAWPGEDAVGKRLRMDADPNTPWTTIVGVVTDSRQLGLNEPPPPVGYLPYQQMPLPFTVVAVRSPQSAGNIASMLRSELTSVDPNLAWIEIEPLQSVLDQSISQPRFRTTLISIFAALALLLSAVGVYGLVSYSVTQRMREFGIRMALGAQPSQVLLPVLREGIVLVAIGVTLGIGGALAATRVLERFLFGIGATDPLTFVVVAVVLLAVTLLASYLPSRRAARVDPLAVLRE
jgi:putative ABC transport system permease protein